MLRPIVKHGERVLQTPALPVTQFDESLHTSWTTCCRPIRRTRHRPGAPQIDVPRRVCGIDLTVGKRGGEVITLVNPVFVERDGMQLEEEGCLSVPGFQATVPRPSRVVVKGQDIHGKEVVVEGTGLLARALQHELDHLDGRLFLDRLRALQRDLIVKKIRKLRRAGKW